MAIAIGRPLKTRSEVSEVHYMRVMKEGITGPRKTRSEVSEVRCMRVMKEGITGMYIITTADVLMWLA